MPLLANFLFIFAFQRFVSFLCIMLKLILALLVTTLLYSCSFDADQEKAILDTTTRYIFAGNNSLPLSIAGLTHPEILKSLMKRSDTVILAHFEKELIYRRDPVILENKQDGDVIHVKIQVEERFSEYEGHDTLVKGNLYLVSENDGKNWFVVSKKDYESKKIGNFKRLL